MGALGDDAWRTIAGTALAVLGVCVLLFTAVGALRGDDTAAPEVASSPSDEPAEPSDASESGAATSPSEDPVTASPDDTATPTPTDEPTEPAPTQSEPAPEPTSEEPEPEPEPTSEEPEPEPTSEEPPAATIPPGDITVQVLDADGAGSRTTFDREVARLREAGFNVVVTNDASRVYEQTTVLYSGGRETAARELAAALGYSQVAAKPSNLSDSVWVHVVIGRDTTG